MQNRRMLYSGLRSVGKLLPLWLVVACADLLGTGGSDVLEVLSVTPEGGGSQVSVFSTVTITFSAELDPSTVAEAVSLRAGEQRIQTVKTLQNRRALHMEPTDPLDFGTSYEVLVDSGLKSRSGKALAEPESWSFSTEGDPLPIPDIDSLRLTLGLLAHDSLMGRGSGTTYEARAAQLLVERFSAYGLDPAPGGWLQEFQATSRRTQHLLSSQNVLATVPGAGDLVDEWVVVGAHYDHIGLREQVDGTLAINNGADDNASGTALLLEMARIFRAYASSGGMTTPHRRSVLFAAFGAEEEGLLGSCHFARESPAVPLPMTRAMMNFDMVGRLRSDVLRVLGLNTSRSWANMVVNANSPRLILDDSPICEACSDFACFRDQGIPFLWFYTGTHGQYHSPRDDVEFINFPGLVEIGEVSLRILSRLAVMPEGPSLLIGGGFQE